MVATDVAIALDNLASATVSKMETINTLVVANKQLAEALAHITKENEKLLNIVSQLTTDAMKAKPCKHGTPNSSCWTHDFIMSVNHNSKICNNKAPGHKIKATKNDTMGKRSKQANHQMMVHTSWRTK